MGLPWPCPEPPHQVMLQAWHQSTLRERAWGSRNDTHKPQEPGSLPGTFRAICSTHKPCPLWGDPRSLPNPEAAICTMVTYGHTQKKARMIRKKELESPQKSPKEVQGTENQAVVKVSGITASVGSQLRGVGGGADPHLLGRTGWAAVPRGGSEKRALTLRPLRGSLKGKDVTARG